MHARSPLSVLSPVLLLAGVLAFLAAPAALGAPPGEDAPAPAAPQPEPDAKAEHAELERGFRKARTDYYAARRDYAARKEAGEDVEPPTAPEAEWVARYMEAAKRRAGTDGAVPFLLSVVSMASRPLPAVAKEALDTLVESHVASPRLGDLTFSLIYYGRELEGATAENALDRIYDATPHTDVKAAMLYARVSLERRHAPQPTAERRAELVASLETVRRHAPESRWAGLAKGDIFELQNLQIGMTAPDIAGEDLAGTPFRLSDYRGNVVVLDFWGDW